MFLTTLSTVLGLVTFLIDGQEEAFWFSFAVGTSGGLLFSILALMFVMPVLEKSLPLGIAQAGLALRSLTRDFHAFEENSFGFARHTRTVSCRTSL